MLLVVNCENTNRRLDERKAAQEFRSCAPTERGSVARHSHDNAGLRQRPRAAPTNQRIANLHRRSEFALWSRAIAIWIFFCLTQLSTTYRSQNSLAVVAGVRNPNECVPANTLYSGRCVAGNVGAIGLVRRNFLNRYGGYIEGFRGWGGEDNAWSHKASLFGRAAPTARKDQDVYHLFHDLSGGYRPGVAGRSYHAE